ncbi:MAG: DUF6350 family protein [Terrimesophilobacter sp.]
MKRPITALFAALEALLVVGIGIGIPLVPLSLLWAFQYGLQIDWTVFWRASVDTWLLGHGSDILLTLDPVTAATVGFDGASTPFVVSIALLGFALLTVLLGMRAGRRIAETPHRFVGLITEVVVFAGLSVAVTFSALHRFARPSIWQGALWPTLVFTVALAAGSAVTSARIRRMTGEGSGLFERVSAGRVREWWQRTPVLRRAILGASLRGGAAAVTALIAVAGILLTVLIALNFGQIIALYERIHAGALGGVTLTIGQLAFLPNLIIWVAAWLVGPGFAIGTGSSVSALGTNLGPIPAVPILGALPTGDLALGFLGLLVPVVIGFLIGVAIRPALLRAIGDDRPVLTQVLTGVGIGIVGGVLVGVLAWLSGGAAGPGRLSHVGPDAFLVGVFAVLEFGAPAVIGLLAGRPPRNK